MIFIILFSIQPPNIKIPLITTPPLIIKPVKSHICLFYLFRAIVKWIGSVLQGGYRYRHVWHQYRTVYSFYALGCYFKYFRHDVSFYNIIRKTFSKSFKYSNYFTPPLPNNTFHISSSTHYAAGNSLYCCKSKAFCVWTTISVWVRERNRL